MPDDVGGRPFPDGWEPDDDRGGADEDFAPVVFDEDFVRAAEVHEPTAVERLLAAAQARAEAEAARAAGAVPGAHDDDPGGGRGRLRDGDHGDADDLWDLDPYGPDGGALRPYRGSARWHRPVAWVLALVMGIGMVALAFTAVYRGASGGRQEPAPSPATTGVDTTAPPGTAAGLPVTPSAEPARSAPRIPADPSAP
ncbi:SCO2584 family spore wall biosynthesis protein [Streptomyces yaizuensis]|uniref:Membrane protein n=1 Tax=Streptomyces yaizuensis TaxID=2989713 RepID=A0ABQ5NU14_9ACTN|nr:hypothetical protein [Streptomyces sp. YSPA8]GLF93742.1 membrane protein [Streptomyces sp. YSPA8]